MAAPANERAALLAAMQGGGQTFHAGPDGRPVAGESSGLRSAPGTVQVGPNAGEKAAQIAAAQKAAEFAADQRRAGFDVDQAAAKAGAEVAAKSTAERADARAKSTVEQDSALAVYEAAMGGLTDSLKGTPTGPIVGRAPALTSGQQIADGGVAAIAPVLKQLFRSAGEGVFTDKDQELLIRMIPTRQDTPAARDFKLKNIDTIVRAKLRNATPKAAAAGGDSARRKALLDKY